jgi:hypothetical protein
LRAQGMDQVVEHLPSMHKTEFKPPKKEKKELIFRSFIKKKLPEQCTERQEVENTEETNIDVIRSFQKRKWR